MSDDAAGGRPGSQIPTVDDFPATGVNALATFAQRAWGRILDTLITLMLVVLVVPFLPIDPEDVEQRYVTLGWLLLTWVVAALAYEVTLIVAFGATVGKFSLGTRVARFVDGGRPTWDQAALRCLLPLTAATALGVPGIPVVGAAIVYVSSLSNELGRGWHDLAGSTVVIRTR